MFNDIVYGSGHELTLATSVVRNKSHYIIFLAVKRNLNFRKKDKASILCFKNLIRILKKKSLSSEHAFSNSYITTKVSLKIKCDHF